MGLRADMVKLEMLNWTHDLLHPSTDSLVDSLTLGYNDPY